MYATLHYTYLVKQIPLKWNTTHFMKESHTWRPKSAIGAEAAGISADEDTVDTTDAVGVDVGVTATWQWQDANLKQQNTISDLIQTSLPTKNIAAFMALLPLSLFVRPADRPTVQPAYN